MVATDLFQLHDDIYLLVIDYFSRYIEIVKVTKSQTSQEIIKGLKDVFARHGIPEQIRSDNGPQYSSAEWGIKNVTSSPKFPSSNGEVERGVRTVKSLLKKENDQPKALLSYRSTPLACGYSPAELLMGRRLRTTLPMLSTSLVPRWPDMERLHLIEEERRKTSQLAYNNRHSTSQQVALEPDQPVYIKDMGLEGTIKGPAETPRSYHVQTPKGTIRRNRSHLQRPSGPQTESKLEPNKPSEKQSQPIQHHEDLKPPSSPCVNTRPKRLIKPSLKIKENLGLV